MFLGQICNHDAEAQGARQATGDDPRITSLGRFLRSVRLDDGAPWAVLELQDDETVQLLGVQANDGDLAIDAVLALRALLVQSRG